jgi:hypothetical protein
MGNRSSGTRNASRVSEQATPLAGLANARNAAGGETPCLVAAAAGRSNEGVGAIRFLHELERACGLVQASGAQQ